MNKFKTTLTNITKEQIDNSTADELWNTMKGNIEEATANIKPVNRFLKKP